METKKSIKLETKLKFLFEDQELFPDFNVVLEAKTIDKKKHIKIIETKKQSDSSCNKLF